VGRLAKVFASAAITNSAIPTSFPMVKADDQGAVRTHPDASRSEKRVPFAIVLPSARLPDTWPMVDPRAPPTTKHDSADEVEWINITDAGSDDSKRTARNRGSDLAPRRFGITCANDALALHSIVTRATDTRIVKGAVIVFTATPYA